MFYRVFLCSIPAALNFTALRGPSPAALSFANSADRLRTADAGLSSLEYGVQTSHQPFSHGFTHCAVAAATAPGLLESAAVEQFQAELTSQCSGKPFDVWFTLAKPVPPIEGGQMRHLVLSRFDEAKLASAAKIEGDTPKAVAEEGYRQFSVMVARYFANVNTVWANDTGGTDVFPVNEFTIVMYSTYYGKADQLGFEKPSSQRTAWKAEFATPYLDVNGTLDFDFTPGVV